MSDSGYRQIAARAIEAGWLPTDVCDPQGRPLWADPEQPGLLPLESIPLAPRNAREAA